MAVTERSNRNPSQRHLNLTAPTTHSGTFARSARRVGTPEKGETYVVVLITQRRLTASWRGYVASMKVQQLVGNRPAAHYEGPAT